MNKLLLSLSLLVVFASGLNAQSASSPAVYESKAELIERYALNDAQQSALDVILARRQSNLAAIESLRVTDESAFWSKRKAIYQGQQKSIERMLTTKQQQTAFSEVKKNDRIAESVIIKRLLAEGHSKEVARFLLLTERY